MPAFNLVPNPNVDNSHYIHHIPKRDMISQALEIIPYLLPPMVLRLREQIDDQHSGELDVPSDIRYS